MILKYYEFLNNILRRKVVWRHNYEVSPVLEGILLHAVMESQGLVIFM